MRKIGALYLAALIVVSSTACDKMNPFKPSKNQGCTDNAALNFDVNADVDGGTCRYSRVLFYIAAPFPLTALPINISVDGVPIGSANTFYVNGAPGNCIADGAVQFTL